MWHGTGSCATLQAIGRLAGERYSRVRQAMAEQVAKTQGKEGLSPPWDVQWLWWELELRSACQEVEKIGIEEIASETPGGSLLETFLLSLKDERKQRRSNQAKPGSAQVSNGPKNGTAISVTVTCSINRIRAGLREDHALKRERI